MSALSRLGEVSLSYQVAADEYRDVAVDAAEAEAAHRSEKAKAVLRYRALDDVRSHAEAEARADADDDIADLHRQRLVTAAVADSHKAKLAQLKEQVATGRTRVVAERTVDQLHADRVSGAA